MHLRTVAARRLLSFASCGSAILGLVAGLQQALAQDAQRLVCVAAADADTGYVHTMGDILGGGVLIGAGNGLFLAHEAGGKLTLTPAGQFDGSRVNHMRDFGSAVLIGGESGLFVATAAAGLRRAVNGRTSRYCYDLRRRAPQGGNSALYWCQQWTRMVVHQDQRGGRLDTRFTEQFEVVALPRNQLT